MHQKTSFEGRLADLYGQEIRPENVMAYLAGVMAHPAFTARFQDQLVQPGLRVPLTADKTLFGQAAGLGKEVVWLHCYGERFFIAAGSLGENEENPRPKASPRLPKDEAPRLPAEGSIPGAPEPLPDGIDYDAAKKRLIVGKGFIDNVPPQVWAYEVSGKQVLRQWFSYRKLDRTRPIIGDRRPPSPLDRIQPDHWPDEYTRELMDLLHVLGRLVKLEAAQAELLEKIMDNALIGLEALTPRPDNASET